MRFVSLQQGSPEWHRWRHGGLGASDALALLDVCPASWSPRPTPDRLWAEKTSLYVASEADTYAMRQGRADEGPIRTLYERQAGDLFTPCCVEHDTFPWLRASLDGLSEWGDVVLEVKRPAAEHHRAAKEGRVPGHYRPQLWHQLLVTGCERLVYVSGSRAEEFGGPRLDVAAVEVTAAAEREHMARWLAVAEWWWGCVREGRYPGAWPTQLAAMRDLLRAACGQDGPRKTRRKAGAA